MIDYNTLANSLPSSPLLMEEQPSTSAVEGANIVEEGTLAAIQGVPKAHQGMISCLLSIMEEIFLEDCGNILLHDPGSSLIANLEQQSFIALSKSISEERRTHSSWEHSEKSFI